MQAWVVEELTVFDRSEMDISLKNEQFFFFSQFMKDAGDCLENSLVSFSLEAGRHSSKALRE